MTNESVIFSRLCSGTLRHIGLPWDGFVIGEPVTVMKFNYDGNQPRALTATCRRPDGRREAAF
jgi:hypothetical protein